MKRTAFVVVLTHQPMNRQQSQRLRRVRRDLKALIGEDGLTCDGSHIEDVAAALEQIVSVCRRARATVKQGK